VARGGVTGVLLVGGASRRFGSPKALARVGDETLAERAWRILGEAFDARIAVGKAADGLDLPFPVLDDGTKVRAALAGIVAGARAAPTDVVVVVPVDVPLVTRDSLRALADACADAATTQMGPLPAALRGSALPELERCLAAGQYELRRVFARIDTVTVRVDASELVNVNTPDDLRSVG
jgi:molybdopterin-guanine dinucleotide biosynthesis protein A